jgi:3(or 17)beta-hydroxysteroid dehydrogenase
MTNRLQHKVALITGGGSGIGAATAKRFAEEGAKVIIADIDELEGEKVVSSISAKGQAAYFIKLNVADEGMWIAAYKHIKENDKQLHILVNNAGIGSRAKPVTELSLAEWRQVMAINLDGVFLGTKHAIPLMEETGSGSIVNVSSIEGIQATANESDYIASKGGVRLFTKAIAIECAKAGYPIRVNSVHPGFVPTPLFGGKEVWQKYLETRGQRFVKEVPLNRAAEPYEIANAILFLASDEASYVTGTELVVDGGVVAKL